MTARLLIDRLGDADELDDWINDWSMKNNSAVEMWGGSELHQMIRNFENHGVRVRSSPSPAMTRRLQKSGWEVLAQEFNPDEETCRAGHGSYEGILIRR